MSKSGADYTVPSYLLAADPGIQAADRDARAYFASGERGEFVRSAISTQGVLAKAVGRTTAAYDIQRGPLSPFAMRKVVTSDVAPPGRLIYGRLLGETYTFLDTQDPFTGETFLLLDKIQGILGDCCWKCGAYVKDRWMGDLETHGFAKSFKVNGNWVIGLAPSPSRTEQLLNSLNNKL